jgi:hypothetical protein
VLNNLRNRLRLCLFISSASRTKNSLPAGKLWRRHALRRVVAKAQLDDPVRLFSFGRTSGKEILFISDERCFSVIRLGGDGLSESSAVVHLVDAGSRPVVGLVSVGYVRMISCADRNRPHGWKQFGASLVVMGLLGFTFI